MGEVDYFRESFKYFKQRNKPEILRNVLDLDSTTSNDVVLKCPDLIEKNSDNIYCSKCNELGMVSHQTWEVCSLPGLRGFYHIRNPFTVSGQSKWIKKCLELYPFKPSITNLESNDNSAVSDNSKFMVKLSWATFGYHHNWDTKVYDRSCCSPFPECLFSLSKHIAMCVRFDDFKPEAAIVNYYNKKSSLGIHNDNSEEALNKPIISLSFGQTAIFLIGTDIRNDKPKSLFLRSGDIVVMSGKCRLSYHAVPAIVNEAVEGRYSKLAENDIENCHQEYISTHRINISIRQVYNASTI